MMPPRFAALAATLPERGARANCRGERAGTDRRGLQPLLSWRLPTEDRMQGQEFDETRAVGHLPNLDIEIVHRRARHEDAEQISINLRAAPSFAALGEFLEAANPLLFWMRMLELAWQPWLALPAPRARQPHES
jgi:hypothetical protein